MSTIIYLGSFEMPDGNASANRVLSNAKALRLLGYTVVFCGVETNVSQQNDAVLGFDNHPQKKAKGVFRRFKQLYSIDHYRRVIEQKANVEFVVCYNMFAFQLIKIKKYCKKSGIKVYGDITEWYDTPFSLNPIAILNRIDSAVAMRIITKRFDGIMCASLFLYNYYKKYIKNIALIPPLVDVDEDIWNINHTKTSEIQFVYSGFPGKTKDRLDKIIKAFSLLNSSYRFLFMIAGITQEELIKVFPHIKKSINQLGDKICFCGHLDHNSSVNLIGQSDYLLVVRERTRRNNAGFPTKLVECVTSGTRFVASNFSDVAFYQYKYNLLIGDTKISTISAALEKVIKEHSPYKKQISSQFDYRKYLPAFRDIF